MIVVLAKILRKAGRPEPAAALLKWVLKHRPGTISAFREYCINRMTVRNFSAVIDRCKAVVTMSNAEDALKDVASFFLTRASLKDNTQPALLLPLRNSFRKAAALSLELLEAGRIGVALDAFKESLILAGIPEVTVSEWSAAFGVLSGNPFDKVGRDE